jgi:hypothetical protein
MPEWLKGMVGPTLMLWLCAIAFGVAYAVAPDGEISKRADMAFRFALPLVIASWVTADARKRRKDLCYDYDSFVFFAPYIVPIYLFKTRGVRAFLTLLSFAGIWFIAMMPAFVVTLVREFAR